MLYSNDLSVSPFKLSHKKEYFINEAYFHAGYLWNLILPYDFSNEKIYNKISILKQLWNKILPAIIGVC